MPRLISLAVALALVLAAPASSAEKVTSFDRFRLWNGCKPMRLVVETLHKDAIAIGLTEKDLTAAARSRLRAARLFSADGKGTAWSYLYVNVNVLKAAFGIDIEYKKNVRDLATAVELTTKTWGHGMTGQHGRDSNYVLSWLSRLTDTFIDEYLRVNAGACRKSD